MAKHKFQFKNWQKTLVQWGVLISLILVLTGVVKLGSEKPDPEAWCPMGGLEALATYAANSTLPCSMSSVQVMMGIVLAVAVMLLGKLFCGYLCPVGTVEDFLMGLRKALGWKKGINIRNGSPLDKFLRIFKYALLFVILYSTVTASELFCKNLDPYYAVATGFKGEITLWMSITSLVLVVAGGFFINRFWCRYVCPLGAASNSFKYWIWVVALFGGALLAGIYGWQINWIIVFAVFCGAGYLLEIIAPKPVLQLVTMVKDNSVCNHCQHCTRHCPYGIDLCNAGDGRFTHVDCTLCGECVSACNTGAIQPGIGGRVKGKGWKYVPAIVSLAAVALGIWAGTLFELPTINFKWGIEQADSTGVVKGVPESRLASVKLEGLRSVKCYGSSMAFKAKLQSIPGVHGVKTYVHHHKAEVLIDTTKLNAESLREAIFTPSMFRIWTPDHNKLDSIKIVTIRTENMYDRVDLNYLGLQIRNTGRSIFGLESEFACPMIIRVYMSPEENPDEEWFREIVEKKMLSMPVHGGGTKDTPVDFKFVKMEPGYQMMGVKDYLHKMFAVTSAFTAEFRQRVEQYEGKDQWIYEIPDYNYEKPIIKRTMPFVSNHLSSHEGIIGIYTRLNSDCVPSIQIRFAMPMNSTKVKELLNMDKWTITYAKDDVREVDAKMDFKKTSGSVHKYVPGETDLK